LKFHRERNIDVDIGIKVNVSWVAFNIIIDFCTLSDCLRLDFGVGGFALDWLRSFLIGRTQYVGVGSFQSTAVTCLSGVSQGSVLGPLLFAMYIYPVDSIVAFR